MLGRRIAARQPPPTCQPELQRALLDEWCNIPQDQIDNLILSMPRRCGFKLKPQLKKNLSKRIDRRTMDRTHHNLINSMKSAEGLTRHVALQVDRSKCVSKLLGCSGHAMVPTGGEPGLKPSGRR
ncbi:transposable element Tcb2 transposase [Trichonephila clavipes]|nr:transposable element Tcb2 transposase [Trichonephila clavipes]